MRGGKVNLVCSVHRSETVYCCQQKNYEKSPMTFCEHCLSWYHTKCEEVSKQECDLIDNFKCKNCESWSTKYMQVFKPALETGASSEILIPADEKELSSWFRWKRSIFPWRASQKLFLDDILLISYIWQMQVDSILNSLLAVNIDLIRQQIIQAQFIPLNLSSGVSQLNALVSQVAARDKNFNTSEFTFQEVMNDDGTIDTERVEANRLTKERAIARVQAETETLKVLSYSMLELQEDVIDQFEVIEKCIKVAKNEMTMASMDEFKDLIEELDKTSQPTLHRKLTEKLNKAAKWLEKREKAILNARKSREIRSQKLSDKKH